MNPVSPEALFDLSKYLHKELLMKETEVWNALEKLPIYLKDKKLGKIESEIPKGVTLINPEWISIGKYCHIEEGAYIKGPCIIGDFSQIRSHAYIRGNVITGTHCLIGHTTEIKNSILLNHAAAPHFNYLGDSILGNYTNLGAGAKCSNLRLDKKNIHIIVAGKVFNTNRQKLGLILGDYSQLGCNSVTNPGTIFGQKVLCYPCVTVSGYIPNHSLIKGQKFIIEET